MLSFNVYITDLSSFCGHLIRYLAARNTAYLEASARTPIAKPLNTHSPSTQICTSNSPITWPGRFNCLPRLVLAYKIDCARGNSSFFLLADLLDSWDNVSSRQLPLLAQTTCLLYQHANLSFEWWRNSVTKSDFCLQSCI